MTTTAKIHYLLPCLQQATLLGSPTLHLVTAGVAATVGAMGAHVIAKLWLGMLHSPPSCEFSPDPLDTDNDSTEQGPKQTLQRFFRAPTWRTHVVPIIILISGTLATSALLACGLRMLTLHQQLNRRSGDILLWMDAMLKSVKSIEEQGGALF